MSRIALGKAREACRRRGRLLLTLLPIGLALAGVRPVLGQGTVSPNQTAIEMAGARVDSLRPLLERLSARRDSAREARRLAELERTRVALDTFVVGALRVAATPAQLELAREVFGQAWREWEPLLRGSEELLSGRLFLLISDPGPYQAPGDSAQVVRAGPRVSRETLRRNAYLRIGIVFARALPEDVAQWVGGSPGATENERMWASRELATVPSRAVRGCYRGEAPWCWEALGIADSTGALERWYTPQERRHLVRGSSAGASGTRRAVLWSACLDGESDRRGDQACDLFLKEEGVPVPLSPDARASFLGHALRLGGDGALERLRSGSPRTLTERLLAASGVSADSLALSWRAELLRERPSAWAGLGRTQLAILGWLLLLTFLATRSTRWRLG